MNWIAYLIGAAMLLFILIRSAIYFSYQKSALPKAEADELLRRLLLREREDG